MLSNGIVASSSSSSSSWNTSEISNTSCLNNASIWLLVHFVYSCIISIESSLLIVIILLLNQLRFTNEQVERNPNDDEFVRPQRHHFLALIKEDILVVFFYTSSAFLYTCFWLAKSYQSVSWMHFIRWSIEATCIPFIVPAFYCGLFDFFLINYKSGAYMTGLIMLKLPVFFLTRYVETESIVILDRLQVGLFYLFCNSSNYSISDHYLLNLVVR